MSEPDLHANLEPGEQPEQAVIVVELLPPMAEIVVCMAAEFKEPPSRTVHRLLMVALSVREGFHSWMEALDMLTDRPADDDTKAEESR